MEQGQPPQQMPYQEAYPVQGVPAAQYPSVNVAPAQYPGAPPMQSPYQQPYPYPYQPSPSPVPSPYVVQNQPSTYVLLDGTVFGYSSQSCTCPTCREVVRTRTSRAPSAAAWVSFVILLVLFAFFWLLPLCCLPFCIPSCYNVKHYCPQCGAFLGERRS